MRREGRARAAAATAASFHLHLHLHLQSVEAKLKQRQKVSPTRRVWRLPVTQGQAPKKQKNVAVLLCQEPGGQTTQGQAPQKMLLCYCARGPGARRKTTTHKPHEMVVSCN